jgi:xanthine dehydrogenase accessory factor
MDLATLEMLNAARRDRRPAILVTDIATGRSRLVGPDDLGSEGSLAAELTARFRSGVSGMVAGPGGEPVFLTVQLPPPRLVMIGAVHISQALAPMAALAGFEVTIIDPRTAFATVERFPDVRLIAEWPKDALPKVGLDAYTALAALSHDPKIDDGAIAAALASGCFYVGALGSRKTHAKRIERLRAAGVSDSDLGRIRAPIGLAISAQSPAEIAVAILAEMIAALRTTDAARKEAVA